MIFGTIVGSLADKTYATMTFLLTSTPDYLDDGGRCLLATPSTSVSMHACFCALCSAVDASKIYVQDLAA